MTPSFGKAPVSGLGARLLALALGAALGLNPAVAAISTWSGASSLNLSDAGNWNTLPVSADSWVFNAAGAFGSTLNNDLTANLNVAGITFSAGTATTTSASASSGATSLTLTTVAGLSIGSRIAGTSIPAGTTVTAIAGNVVTLSQATIATIASGVSVGYNGGAFTLAGNAINLGGNVLVNTGGANQVINLDMALTANRSFTANSATLALNGVISGGFNATFNAANGGTISLTGANTYTGATTIQNSGSGVTNVTSLNSVATNAGLGTVKAASSNLGAPTTVANGTINIGAAQQTSGILRYNGSGETTDRVINLASATGGSILDQSGSGLLKFTSSFTATGGGAKTLTLQGSTAGTGEIAGAIVDNVSSLTTLSVATTATPVSTLTLGSVNGVNVGATITGAGIAAGTTITGIAGNVVTLSQPTNGVAMVVPTAITVDGASITNPTSLTKSGTGTWTLSGANTYSGATTVSAGVLNLQNATALGSTAAGTTVTSGAALQLQNNITVGAEALTLSGTGIASDGALRNISGTNTYGGLLTLGAATRINSDSGTLTLSNAGTITGSGFGLTVGGAGNTTIASILGTGAGTLTKDGAGTLTLSGANTYTGATTLNAGTLALNSTTALGTAAGTFTINGGTLDNTSGAALTLANAKPVTIAGDFAAFNSGSTSTSNLNLGTGATSLGMSSNAAGVSNKTITLNGTGTSLTLGGTVTAISVSTTNGTLNVNGAGNTLNLGSLNLSSNGNQRQLTLGGTGNVTVSGQLISTGTTASSLAYAGSGTLTLGGASQSTVVGSGGSGLSAFSGTFKLDESAMAGTQNILLSTNAFNLRGGGLTIFGGNQSFATINALNTGSTITLDKGAGAGASLTATTFTRTAGHTLLLDLANAGTGSFTASNLVTAENLDGWAVVYDGTNYKFATNSAAGVFSATAESTSTALPTSGATNATSYTVSGNTTLTANSAGRSLTISGAGSTLDLGTRTLTLGSTTAAPALTTTAGILVTGSGANVIQNGTLAGVSTNYEINLHNFGTGGLTVSSAISSGTSPFAVGGTGNTTLAGAINGTGLFTLGGSGTTTLASGFSLANNNALTLSGSATLDLGGQSIATTGVVTHNSTSAGGITNSGAAATLTMGNNSQAGVNSTFSGNLALVLNAAASTSHFSSTFTNTGNLTLNANGAGLVFLGGSATTTAGSIGFGTVNNTGTITNSGTGTGAVTIGSNLGANVTAVNQASATSALTLSGTNTAYRGTTTLATGAQLNLGSATALGGNGSTTGTGGALVFSGNNTLDNTSGASLTLTTANALALNGDLTFTGTNNLTFGSGAVTLANGTRTLTTTANTLTFNGAIGDGGNALGLTKAGAGTLTLAGLNTYTGATTVTGTGTLAFAPTAGGSQTLGSLALAGRDATLRSTFAGSGSFLTFTSLAARNAGDTGIFIASGGTNGTTNKITLTGQSAGLIDQGTFFGTSTGSDFAFYDAAGFVRGINYGVDADTTTAAGGASLTGTHAQTTGAVTAQTTATFSTLKLSGNTNVTLAAGQTLTTSGLLKAGNVAGGATLSGGTGIQAANNTELVVRTDGANDTLTISTAILANGSNALTKSGAGTLTLSGANTYTGATTVNAGTLRIGAGGATGDLGSSPSVALNGGNLTFNRTAPLTTGAGLAFNAAATVTNSNTSNAVTIQGDITQASNVTANYAGSGATLALTGNYTAANTSLGQAFNVNTGATLWLAPTGTNTVSISSTAGANTGVVGINAGATLNLGGDGVTYAATTSTNNIFNTTSGTTFVGTAGTVKVNSGLWNLGDVTSGNTNGYVQAFQVLGGTATFTGARYIEAGTLTVGGGTLKFANAGSQVVNANRFALSNGVIAGGGATLNVTSGFVDIATGSAAAQIGGDTTVVETGLFNQSGGTVQVAVTPSAGGSVTGLKIGASTSAVVQNNAYTLTGGTLVVNGGISSSLSTGVGSTANFNFMGGTLTTDSYDATNLGSNAAATFSSGQTTSNTVGTLINYGGTLAPGGNLVTSSTTNGTTTLTLTPTSGTTAITGNYVVASANAALAVNLGGTTASTAFQDAANSGKFGNLTLAGTGTNTLGGNLLIKLIEGTTPGTLFAPANGDSFKILSFTGAGATNSGTFSGANLGAISFGSGQGVVATDGLTVFGLTYDNTAVTGGVTLSGATINQWAGASGSNFTTLASWTGMVPTSGAIAQFADHPAAGAVTVNLDANQTVQGLVFNSTTRNYTVSTGSANAFTLDNTTNSAAATITDSSAGAGNHTVSVPLTLASNLTATVTDAANTLTLGGAIGEASVGKTLTKAGAGTLVLTGTNTYTGATTVSAGTLQLGDGTTDGSILTTSAITNNAALVFNLVGSQTDAMGISGTGALTKTGAGTLVLSGTNTFTSATTINAGSLQLGAGGTTGTLAASGALINNANLTINRSNAVVQGTDFSSSAITGTGSFTQAGSGTTTLNTANSYTGLTTVSAGALNIQNATALGTTAAGTTVASGAALQFQGGITVGAEALTLAGTGVANDGALRNISGDNTYGGLLTLGAATRINSDAGTLTLSNTGTITGSGFGLTVGGAGNTAIASLLGTGAGTLTKDGTGTLTLSGLSSTAGSNYTGATTIDQGTLALAGNVALAGNLAFGSVDGTTTTGSLNLSSGSLTTTGLSVRSNSATANTITLGSGQTLTTNGNVNIGDGTSFSVSGNPTTKLTVAGTTSADGTWNMVSSNGTFRVGEIASGASARLSLSTLDLSGLATFSADLRTGGAGSSGGTFAVSGTAGTVGGLGGIGSATLLLAANSTISAGTVNLTNTAGGTETSTLKLGSGTQILNANTINLSTGARGSSSLSFNTGSGTLKLRGTDGTSRNTSLTLLTGTLTGGSVTSTFDVTGHAADLLLGAVKVLDSTGNVGATSGTNYTATFSFDQGTLDATSFLIGSKSSGNASTNTLAGIVNLGSSSNLTNTASLGTVTMASLTTGGTLTATAPLTGTLNIAGSATTVGMTSLKVANYTASATTGSATGTVNISGGATTVTNGITLAARTTVGTVNGTLNLTGGSLSVGTAGVSSTNGIFTTGSLGTVTTTLTLDGGALNLNGNAIGGTGQLITTLNFNSGTLSNVSELNAGAAWVKATGGTLLLAGTNTFTGATTVSAGTLQAASTSALGNNSAFTLANTAGATLDLNGFSNSIGSLAGGGATGGNVSLGAANLTAGGDGTSTSYAGALSGTGGVTKVGGGTFTLTGANSYTGTTTVSAGAFNVGSSGSLASGNALNLGVGGTADFANAGQTLGAVTNANATTGSLHFSATTGTVTVGSLSGAGSTTFASVAALGTLAGGSVNLNGTTSEVTTLNGGTVNLGVGTTLSVFAGTSAGSITGTAGNLTKTGAGTLTLTGVNTYTGTTTVSAGTLTLNATGGAAALAQTSGVTLGTGGTLALGAANQIANTANLTLGGGTLTLGGFDQTLGTLALTAASTLDFTGSADLVFADSSAVSWSATTLTISNFHTGENTLRVGNSITGLTTDQLALFRFYDFGNSAARIDADGFVAPLSLNYSNVGASDLVIDSAITGTTTVTQSGTASTTLTGANTSTGLASVTTGTLVIGTAAGGNWAGNVTVSGTGILKGRGTITGDVVINAAGTYSPGNSPAIQNVGSLTVNSGGFVEIELDGASAGTGAGFHDQIASVGAVTLNGGTLSAATIFAGSSAPAYVPTFGASHTIITGSTITGTFDAYNFAVAGNPNGMTWLPEYTATAVNLSAVPDNYGTFAGLTVSQTRLGAALQSLRPAQVDLRAAPTATDTLFNRLIRLDLAGLRTAYDQLSPEKLTALAAVTFQSSSLLNSSLLTRSAELRRVGPASVSLNGVAVPASAEEFTIETVIESGVQYQIAKTKPKKRVGYFAGASGAFAAVDGSANRLGSFSQTGAGHFGFDYTVNENQSLGLVVSQALADTDFAGASGSARTTTSRVGVFHDYHRDGFYLNSSASVGFSSYDSKRKIGFLNQTASGETQGLSYGGQLATGYDFKVGDFIIGPTASLAYDHARIDAFGETGSAADLNVGRQSADSLVTALGLRVSRPFSWNRLGWIPELSLGVSRQHFNPNAITARFAAGGDAFKVQPQDGGGEFINPGASLTVMGGQGWSVRLGYSAILSPASAEHRVDLSVNAGF